MSNWGTSSSIDRVEAFWSCLVCLEDGWINRYNFGQNVVSLEH